MNVAPNHESDRADDPSAQRRADLMIYGEMRPRRFSTASMGGGDVAGPQPEARTHGEGQQQGQMFGEDMFAGREATRLPKPKKPASTVGGWYDPAIQD